MIRVNIEVREGALTRRVQITAPPSSALGITSAGMPDRVVHLVFTIDPEAFFVPEDSSRRRLETGTSTRRADEAVIAPERRQRGLAPAVHEEAYRGWAGNQQRSRL
jgi:hypothetical protein